MKLIALFLTLLLAIVTNNAIELMVFSFDRPLQLHTFLASLEHYTTGLAQVTVLYKVSSQQYQEEYNKVASYFPDYYFVNQDKEGHSFGSVVAQTIKDNSLEYIVFAVDDNIIVDYFNFQDCVQALSSSQSYGFYLRLGHNITHCYPEGGRFTPVPENQLLRDGIYRYTFKDGTGDWKYPHNVDMTVYHKKTIEEDLLFLYQLGLINSPNELESAWAGLPYQKETGLWEKKGLFFERSKLINIPLNVVNTFLPHNRSMQGYSKDFLLNLYQNNYIIDYLYFEKIHNTALHIEPLIQFVLLTN